MESLTIKYLPYTFNFNFPGGTSRGVLTQKESWFLKVNKKTEPSIIGYGEISILPGLSPESPKAITTILEQLSANPAHFINDIAHTLKNYPAVRFGLETALSDLETGGKQLLHPSPFTKGKQGIPINGLIWMGQKELMLQRIKEKLDQGFSCLKLKVGAINFNEEIELLKNIRKSFSSETLELRVDANGAFNPDEAIQKLEQLATFHIHSIEQPIAQKQWKEMRYLCANTPVPIALDEELIGVTDRETQEELLKYTMPQYLIFKPSLIGGLQVTKAWSELADENNIGWWVTSALEGNIGLNAIAQWTFNHGSKMPQGLGTGQVFTNNIDSPLLIKGEELWFNNTTQFNFNF